MKELDLNNIEDLTKVGRLFEKISDAYNTLDKEEKQIIKDCFPVDPNFLEDFFEALDLCYVKSGQYTMRMFWKCQKHMTESYLDFCKEVKMHPKTHEPL